MKQKIQTDKAPAPAGAYSQGIRVGNMVFVAGQGPRDPITNEKAETVEEQTRQVLTNVKNILEAGGASMSDVVKVTAHLTDLANFQAFNRVYMEFFEEPLPVRTTVGSALNNMLVEVDVIAVVSE
jgi:2-iminobutanoate/2-iminopropanoate deaminase